MSLTNLIVGCGFLGRRVGRLLKESGQTVFGTTRSLESSASLKDWGIEPIVADVLEPETLQALPNVDRVLYCVGFDRTLGLPIRTVYVDGFRSFLEVAGSRFQRLVYASSTGVYGRDSEWVDEETPPEPRHESGKACLDAERLALQFAESDGFESILLRFAGLYGPNRVIRRAAIERGETILGAPDKYLNVIHIDDAALATVAALDRGLSGRTYLISDDRPVQRTEYYGKVAEVIHAPPPRFAPPAPGSPEALREEANKRVRNTRMRSELGVVLQYPDINAGLPAALLAES